MPQFRLSLCALAASFAACAAAVQGPTPLAWRWTGKTNFPATAKPTVSDGMVIVPVGRRVHALDAASGTQKWVFPAGEEPEGDFRASLVVSGDIVVAANTNRFVYGINKRDGRTAWSFHLGTSVGRALVAEGDTVYVFTSDNHVVALNAANGTKSWAEDFEMETNLVGDPVIAEGNLIFFVSSGQLVALNTVTRKPAWAIRVESVNPEGGPTVLGQSIYVVSGPQVAEINPRTGRTVRVLKFPERLAAGAGVSPKGGAVATDDGKVFVFSLSGRNVSPEPIQLPGYLSGSPQAAGDNILVKMRNGSLHLIDPSRGNGAVIWEYTTLALAGSRRVVTSSGGGGGGPGGGNGQYGAGGGVQTTTVAADYVAILGPVTVTGSSMYALAEDGSVFAWGGQLGVDQIGPAISMLAPPMGAAMSGLPDLDFIFRIEDQATGVMSKSIKVKMNGQDVNHEYTPGGGYVYARIRQAGSTEPGANLPLSDGRKTITVAAADWMGNLSEKTFYVIIDNTLPVIRERRADERPGGRGGGGGGAGGGGIG